MPDRRRVIMGLGALTCLLSAGLGARAFGGSAGRALRHWAGRIDELSAALRGQTVTVDDWRAGLNGLFASVALDDVLADIDLARLRRAAGTAELGVTTTRVRLPGQGTTQLAFYPKFFAVGKGRSIIPHAHANMVSAHLVLDGTFHLRQYDHLSRTETDVVLRPTIDTSVGPGDLSSIGVERDNAHWFIAEEDAATFDVVITGLDETESERYRIFNLDMTAARDQRDGTMVVPRLGVAEALAKYG